MRDPASRTPWTRGGPCCRDGFPLQPDPAPTSLSAPPPETRPLPFQVEVLDDGVGAVTITVSGELDLVSIGSFQATVEAVLASNPRTVVFDLTRCPFVSVRGFSVIGRCGTRVDEVVVVAASAFVPRVIGLLGFDRVSTVVRELG